MAAMGLGLLLSARISAAPYVAPSLADSTPPNPDRPYSEISPERTDSGALKVRSSRQVDAQTKTPIARHTESNVDSGILDTTVEERCEQQIESAEVRALRVRANTLLRRKRVANPQAWSRVVAKALCATGMPTTPQYFAFVLALIEKESSFIAHGLLPEQPHAFRKIAHRIIDRLFQDPSKAVRRLIGRSQTLEFIPVIFDLLKKTGIVDSAEAKKIFDNYYKRYQWHRVRTEWDVENIVVDDINKIADSNTAIGFLLKALFQLKPEVHERLQRRLLFRTVGPLQVPIADAHRLAKADGLSHTEDEIRDILYTIWGGVYFGTRRLNDLVNIYANPPGLDTTAVGFITVDYTRPKFSARNQALIEQLSRLSKAPFPKQTRMSSPHVGRALRVLTTEMLSTNEGPPPKKRISATVNEFRKSLSRRRVEKQPLYLYIKEQYRLRFNENPAYAAIPDTCSRPYKGGVICIGSIARRVISKFTENCSVLGCGPQIPSAN